MLINIRDNSGNLLAKDILDIDFDMKVEQENNVFKVRINNLYIYAEEYEDKEAAENSLLNIAVTRNQIENQLLALE